MLSQSQAAEASRLPWELCKEMDTCQEQGGNQSAAGLMVVGLISLWPAWQQCGNAKLQRRKRNKVSPWTSWEKVLFTDVGSGQAQGEGRVHPLVTLDSH